MTITVLLCPDNPKSTDPENVTIPLLAEQHPCLLIYAF